MPLEQMRPDSVGTKSRSGKCAPEDRGRAVVERLDIAVPAGEVLQQHARLLTRSRHADQHHQSEQYALHSLQRYYSRVEFVSRLEDLPEEKVVLAPDCGPSGLARRGRNRDGASPRNPCQS